MRIEHFLLPKDRVAYLTANATMHDAITHLERCHYSAIPIIDEAAGKYIGTLSEGDLLWKLKNTPGLTFDNLDTIPVTQIKKRIHHECVRLGADLDDMLQLAADQNFVPVVDDDGMFIGIIRRKDIIEYYTRNITD
ncbi:MAG: CBS domain-containing protein [Cohnella sp.]|nr:CBS domain-containing protein [Cohnella sp.]